MWYCRLKGWWLRQLQKREKPRPPSALELFFIGAMYVIVWCHMYRVVSHDLIAYVIVFVNSAKAVATVATYPYIMARVRLQLKPVPGQAVVVYAGNNTTPRMMAVLWLVINVDV